MNVPSRILVVFYSRSETPAAQARASGSVWTINV